MNTKETFQPTMSTLILSIGSAAAMAMGLAPNPSTKKVEKDLDMAKFQIDLLVVIRDKTKGNLTDEEQTFLDSVVSDLQMKFVQLK